MIRYAGLLFILCTQFLLSCAQPVKKQPADIPHRIADSSWNKIPEPLGWISDFEHIFSKAEISYLDSLITAYEKETGIQIAVVTVPSSWTSPEEFDDFVLAILRKWGVGQKGVNNGIVMGISPVYRKIRISNGYGIEARMPDEETKKILDNYILPAFRQAQYFEGVKKGLLATMEHLR